MTSEISDNLGLPYLMPAQAQKHVTHNKALRVLDAIVQIGVEDRDLGAPPSAPDGGGRYIVADGASGDWAGRSGEIACWQDGAWAFYPPSEGWTAWVSDEDVLVVWNGSAWEPVGISDTQNLPMVGINTTADTTNRLAVKSDAVLFSHDDVTPGTGSIQVVYNKSASNKTASFLFQDNFSGRGEVGLTGDDDLHFKVSPDGSSWKDALKIDKSSGVVSMPFTPHREVLTANRNYYVDDTNGNDANTGLASGSGNAFKTQQKAVDTAAALDLSIYDVYIYCANGTYSTATGVVLKSAAGSGTIHIIGDTTTPSNVVVTTTGAMTGNNANFYAGACRTKYIIEGFKLTSSASGTRYALAADVGSFIEFKDMDFGAGFSSHCRVANGSIMRPFGNYSISGGAAQHVNAVALGIFRSVTASPTVNIAASLTFSGQFVQAGNGSQVLMNNYTYTGSSFTGTAYVVSSNSVLQIGAATIPGSAAGTTSSGGQVV